MKGMFFTSGLAACLLFASGIASRAQTNPPIQIQQRLREQPTSQASLAPGATIGGPYGVLTEEQRASYQTAMNAAKGRLADLRSQLIAANKEVLNAGLVQPFDEDLVREKALAAARIDSEMVVLRAKVYAEVQPPLSPEQIEKIKSGQTAGPRVMERPIPRPGIPPAVTNQDPNGLPPKQ